MRTNPVTSVPSLAEAATWSPDQIVQTMGKLTSELQSVQQQVEWFRRQLFGQKSEKRHLEPDPKQMTLGELPVPETAPEPAGKKVAAHTRGARSRDCAADGSDLFFDETKVPVETIELPNPEIEGLAPDQYEVLSHKTSFRLAQRPGSYVILKYVRPVIKRLDTQTLSAAPAPVGVLEGSRADVSFVAGLLVDKFCYHQPLYRQHQRLGDNGITVSRPWLTQIGQQGIGLIEPIYAAQFDSIRLSRVKLMDETPIKAGRAGPGKMKGGYFWPVYGEHDEICFAFHPSRQGKHIRETLGAGPPPKDAVLVTDGYEAYAAYARTMGLTHAQCWAHTRRKFFDAQMLEPERCGEALEMIGVLYAVEKHIRDHDLVGEKLLAWRQTHARPIVERLFAWIDACFEAQGLLPSSPLTKALAYARERREGLSVYLTDPDVPIDTNQIERTLRVIPMGRRNWLFCWTELGAKQVGIIQSLLTTCRLHDIDPYTWLVDVLQRVGQHPAADVAQLTPRLWKQHFADNPLRSDLERVAGK